MDFGCKHYKRNCKIISPCCNKVYYCRLCHDEDIINLPTKDYHTINRFLISTIICANCNTQQNVSNECANCHIKFGNYFCNICKLYDNTDKDQFHCDKCGICRIGKSNSYHCDGCKICMSVSSKDNHKCLQQNDLNCPICCEDLFTSTTNTIRLQCNHPIHEYCLMEYLKTNYRCPFCYKSIVDLTEYNKLMDQEINNYIVPDEYKNIIVNVLCNECEMKFSTSFHIVGYKCTSCGSYNTRPL